MKPSMPVIKGKVFSIDDCPRGYTVVLKDIKGRVTACHITHDIMISYAQRNGQLIEDTEIMVKGFIDYNMYGNEVFYAETIISSR